MHKIWLVLKREYKTRVRRKIFIITTLLTPFFFALAVFIPVFLSQFNNKTYHILVKDESGIFENKIGNTPDLKFTYTDLDLKIAKQQYKSKGYSGILYIPDINIYNPKGIQYVSNQQPGLGVERHIQQALAEEIKQRKAAKLELSKTVLENLKVNLNIETKLLGDKGSEKVVSSTLSTVMGYAVGFLLYLVLLIYGSIVMRSVIEEKTNRVVEIIVSTVRPIQLMMGKIIGVAAMGLTQFFVWILMFVGIQAILGYMYGDQLAQMQQMQMMSGQEGVPADMAGGQMAQLIASFQNINFTLIIASFLFYFLGGFFLYAALFAAVGSAASDEGDVQSLSFPITIPVLISFFVMITAIQNPHGDLAFWASMVPFSSPLVMPARIPFGVPSWEIILSMFLLIAGFVLATWVAARIYRTGILMYGKKASIKEIGKWFFHQ